MARFASLIDRLESDSISKTLLHNFTKFLNREPAACHKRFVMTTGAVVAEGCVIARNRAGVEKLLTAVYLKKHDTRDPASNRGS